MSRHSVWEIVFMMVILKIPIVYLAVVVVHAIRAEPRPEEGALVTARIGPDDQGSGWNRRHRRRGPTRPHGGPSRTYARAPRTALRSTEARRR